MRLLSRPSIQRLLEEAVLFEPEVVEELLDVFEVVVEEPVVCGWVQEVWVRPEEGAPETWNGAKRIGVKDMLAVRKVV